MSEGLHVLAWPATFLRSKTTAAIFPHASSTFHSFSQASIYDVVMRENLASRNSDYKTEVVNRY
jgi:hypothetical protein